MSWKAIGKSITRGLKDTWDTMDPVLQVVYPPYGAIKQARMQAGQQDRALEEQQKAQEQAALIASEQAANNAETLRRARAKGSRMPEADSYRRSPGGGTLLTGPSGVNTNRVLLGNTNKLGF